MKLEPRRIGSRTCTKSPSTIATVYPWHDFVSKNLKFLEILDQYCLKDISVEASAKVQDLAPKAYEELDTIKKYLYLQYDFALVYLWYRYLQSRK